MTHIFRHPIKAHSSEALDGVDLAANQTLPWDRVWAVKHERSKADGSEWARCGNFSRGADVATLMSVTCTFDVSTETITLSHPDLPDLMAQPDKEGEQIIDWISQVMPRTARKSTEVIRAKSADHGQGLTDNPKPYVSILGHASRRALGGKAGRDLSMLRFRGNIWVDDLGPWEEFEWVGRRLRIGESELEVEDRIDRCPATTVNPETGKRDTETLALLKEGWGHMDFGVFARVTRSGRIALDDTVEVVG